MAAALVAADWERALCKAFARGPGNKRSFERGPPSFRQEGKGKSSSRPGQPWARFVVSAKLRQQGSSQRPRP